MPRNILYTNVNLYMIVEIMMQLTKFTFYENRRTTLTTGKVERIHTRKPNHENKEERVLASKKCCHEPDTSFLH